ncbi:MAG TPA: tetratricopeptide repeat protein [Pirellulales bacterium]|jgi:tetratricopeptide (TPR) repeat protein|nr:tetratricopeptide repeat protein [Pirellulales bacterium]
MTETPWRKADWSIIAALVVVPGVLFCRAFPYGFVNFDDPHYVTSNWHVHAGLCREGVWWALTSTDEANWFPLTWLSLQLDATLYGMNATGFRLTNLLLHLTSTVLLYATLRKVTGAPLKSGCVAALFALHPLHVESVVWVTERKDMLSGLFWMLTLWAYERYASRPTLIRYLGVAVALGLGMAAKPMAVTLPCVLLLLDWWPLGRWPEMRPAGRGRGGAPLAEPYAAASPGRLILEKIPLLILSLTSSLVTMVVQRGGGAIPTEESLPITQRLTNMPISYVVYLVKGAWPANLAVFYPHPGDKQSVALSLAALALLVAVTCWVTLLRRQQPYLAVGWFWYVGTLVPVIGLVQVGRQAYADRYTYLPLIGIFLAVVWGLEELSRRGWASRQLLLTLGVAALVWFGAFTWMQIGYWRDDVVLWQHSIEITGPSLQAYEGLSEALLQRGRSAEAVPYLEELTARAPFFTAGQINLGLALMNVGKTSQAKARFDEALRLDPRNADAHHNLALLLDAEGKSDEAERHLRAALDAQPTFWRTHLLLSEILKRRGESAEAELHVRQALAINPRALERMTQQTPSPDG